MATGNGAERLQSEADCAHDRLFIGLSFCDDCVSPSELECKLLEDYITPLWFFTDTSDRRAAGNDL